MRAIASADLRELGGSIERLTGVTKGKAAPPTTSPVRRILAALDGSDASRRALEWATGLGAALGARVTAASVAPPRSMSDRSGRLWQGWSAGGALFEEYEEHAARVLEEAKTRAAAGGVRLATQVARGSPAAALVKAADALGADLLVLGSHGHGGLERAVRLGSVAEAVKHRAGCSVLIARTPYPPKAAVLGVDGSPASKAAAAFGLRICRAAGATPVVVHAFDRFYGFARLGKAADEAEAATAMDSFEARTVQYRRRAGRAPSVLSEAAAKEGAGLIVVGARGMGAVRSRLLGSVSDQVTRYADASVLVVK